MAKAIISCDNLLTNASGVMPGTLGAKTGDTSLCRHLAERDCVDRVTP